MFIEPESIVRLLSLVVIPFAGDSFLLNAYNTVRLSAVMVAPVLTIVASFKLTRDEGEGVGGSGWSGRGVQVLLVLVHIHTNCAFCMEAMSVEARHGRCLDYMWNKLWSGGVLTFSFFLQDMVKLQQVEDS